MDLNQILDLLVALHRRLAAMQQVELELQPADSALVVNTMPFLLLNILGLVLIHSLRTVPSGAALAIGIGPSRSQAEIDFGGLQNLADLPPKNFLGEHENALLTALSAEAIIEPKACRIVVRLPMQP